ncbi:hypothetical protein ELQ35_07880 [Peribacillus cavernae]|uniref:Lipoprotein n=1 Tax=Peribacillus cavernae TaxID=1674310 RepID=A0A3S0VLG5_9BACI|nr:hypothetical protein [Peribacillus cavernae]MDQ0217286.1 hypothetical protein [Peribacillus cavernae]RUQ30248.1 hypothetical protein ELQ35_07880 [Peribacillus cavernae]
MGRLNVFFIGFSIIGILLSGCGTKADDNAGEDKKEGNAKQNEETVKHNRGDTNENNTDESGKENGEQTKDEGNSGTIRIMEQNLQYEVNGEAKEETAFLTNSNNQKFSLYVLPEYELNGEEPGKDILTHKGEKGVSMRIELLPDDVDWTATEENTKAQLKAISDSVTAITKSGLTVDNGTVQEVISGNERVTAVLIKDKKTPVRLTIYTTIDADHRQVFIEMGKTILKTN